MSKYTRFVRLILPADARCPVCKERVPRGDEAIWLKGEDYGVFHENCAIKADLIPDTRESHDSTS